MIARRLVPVLASLLVLASCGKSDPIAALINKAFPPFDSTEAALAALTNSDTALSHLQSPNISVFISAADIADVLKRQHRWCRESRQLTHHLASKEYWSMPNWTK